VRTVLAGRRPLPAAAPAPGRAMAAARADHPRHVLFVEDEVVLRMSTVDMLERLGCMVSAVGSAEQALELLDRGDRFGLLLTDLGLPGMTGEELAAEVQRRFPGLPVVIASGYGKSESQPGDLRFIGKPYSSIDLQQALAEVARKGATA
jgi:CheY-like chemotaxis protein